MINVITLGRASGLIGNLFLAYPQYCLHKIDSNIKEENSERIKIKSIPYFSSHQEYEEMCPSLKLFFSDQNKDDEIIFICVGSAEITRLLFKNS